MDELRKPFSSSEEQGGIYSRAHCRRPESPALSLGISKDNLPFVEPHG